MAPKVVQPAAGSLRCDEFLRGLLKPTSYITQESNKLEVNVRPPMAVTNAVSWRVEGIKHKKNEVFLDVVESVNLLVRKRGQPRRKERGAESSHEWWRSRSLCGRAQCNANGTVLRSEILGAIKMKVQLSGMPELRLGLNDKILFEATGRSTQGRKSGSEGGGNHGSRRGL